MGLSIVVMMTLANILNMIIDGVETVRVKIYKHTHNKRKWNHGSWIIREE